MVQANQRPGAPFKDDRLELSSSGKSRSDPARMRARAGQRGRGRQSLDVGRDLKRGLTNPTIDENVRDAPPLGYLNDLNMGLPLITAYLLCHRSPHQIYIQCRADLGGMSESRGLINCLLCAEGMPAHR